MTDNAALYHWLVSLSWMLPVVYLVLLLLQMVFQCYMLHRAEQHRSDKWLDRVHDALQYSGKTINHVTWVVWFAFVLAVVFLKH